MERTLELSGMYIICNVKEKVLLCWRLCVWAREGTYVVNSALLLRGSKSSCTSLIWWWFGRESVSCVFSEVWTVSNRIRRTWMPRFYWRQSLSRVFSDPLFFGYNPSNVPHVDDHQSKPNQFPHYLILM